MTSPTSPLPQVSPNEARGLVDEGALLLDVREDDEWLAGHVDGARHVPLSQVGAAEVPHDRTVVVVCRSGARSARAVAVLSGSGVQAVDLAGGMTAWAAAGLPLVCAVGGEPRVL